MSKELKYMMADAVKSDLDQSENVLVLGLLAMNAEATVALRSTLREQGASFRVIHNRSSRYALDDARKGLADLFVGQTAIAVSSREETDFIGLAKTFVAAAKKKHLVLRGGYVDGDLFDEAGFEALAKSPDKPTLRAMLCGMLLAPGRGLAVALNGVSSGLARCIDGHAGDAGDEAVAPEADAPATDASDADAPQAEAAPEAASEETPE